VGTLVPVCPFNGLGTCQDRVLYHSLCCIRGLDRSNSVLVILQKEDRTAYYLGTYALRWYLDDDDDSNNNNHTATRQREKRMIASPDFFDRRSYM